MAGAGVRDLLVDGPWRHRDVAANGIRFHVALGLSWSPDRPLVLLVHGFGEFWWAWRHQIPALDGAGFGVAALDLRGYGASDKPPWGYEPRTTADDISGVIRSLGHRSAVLVGHDWGGIAAWSTAAYAAPQVAGLVSVAAPHPLGFPWSGQLRELSFDQLPLLPERRIGARQGAYIERLLRARAAPGSDFPTTAEARRYREALALWPSPHCALQYQRRFVSLMLGGGGRSYRRALRVPLGAPILSVHGAVDPLLPASASRRAERHLHGDHRLVSLPGVGHLPHEEAPERFNEALLSWLAAGP